jgi:hypothetical protein
MSINPDSLRTALLHTDARLSRFNPLERILHLDDFATGQHGWQGYFPDYDGWDDYPGRYQPVDAVLQAVEKARHDPRMRVDRKLPFGPRAVPMLSSLTSWDVGTAGALTGTYALKIPTLPRAGSKVFAQKRLGSPWRGKFRVETWFCFKSDPEDFRLGETDIRALYLTFDVMDLHHVREHGQEPRRWWPALRYHHAENGELVRRWQANVGSEGVKDGAWEYLPDGQQDLGFNRAATKYQWNYLRFTFDLARHEYVDFHCHGKEFNVQGRRHDPHPPLAGWRASTDKCPGLIGTGFGIETATDKRCFLYLDSIVVSATDS